MHGERIMRSTLTARRAGRLIAATTVVIAALGGLLIWLLDRKEFPSLGSGMWWSIQTVTTVGYGDRVPSTTEGQLIGAIIMVSGIGFITIVSASITAVFVEQARRRLGRSPDAVLIERLERIERRLEEISRSD